MKALRISLILVVIAALVLPVTSIFGQEEVELQLTWWGSQNRHDRTIAVLDLYTAANPNVSFVYEFSNFADYWPLVTTKASGNALPDVMQHDYAFIQDWVASGQLLALDDFIADGTIDVSNVPPSLLEGGMVDGKVYGISLGVNSQSFIIDADAFAEAGIELPANDWTWADFEAIVMQLHDELGIWGFGTLLADEALWKSLYLGHGEWAFSDDNTSIGYENDQYYIDYLNMLLRLQDAGAIPTIEEEVELDEAGPEGSPMVTGESAMQYQWSNQVIAVTNAAGEGRNLILHPLPRPVGGVSQNYLKPSMFFSIPASSDNPEAAAQFISFFTNSLEANEVLSAERGVPISSVVREHLKPLVDPVTQLTFDFLSTVEADASAVPPPDPVGWPEIRDNVFDPLFIEPVRYGELSPEEGMQLLRDEANAILSAN